MGIESVLELMVNDQDGGYLNPSGEGKVPVRVRYFGQAERVGECVASASRLAITGWDLSNVRPPHHCLRQHDKVGTDGHEVELPCRKFPVPENSHLGSEDGCGPTSGSAGSSGGCSAVKEAINSCLLATDSICTTTPYHLLSIRTSKRPPWIQTVSLTFSRLQKLRQVRPLRQALPPPKSKRSEASPPLPPLLPRHRHPNRQPVHPKQPRCNLPTPVTRLHMQAKRVTTMALRVRGTLPTTAPRRPVLPSARSVLPPTNQYRCPP